MVKRPAKKFTVLLLNFTSLPDREMISTRREILTFGRTEKKYRMEVPPRGRTGK
jgi:hypothetical protein